MVTALWKVGVLQHPLLVAVQPSKNVFIQKINPWNKVKKHAENKLETWITIKGLPLQNYTHGGGSFIGGLDCRRPEEQIWPRWRENSWSNRASGHYGSQKETNSDCGFSAPSPEKGKDRLVTQLKMFGDVAGDIAAKMFNLHSQTKANSKKLKVSSNYHFSPTQVHHRREHRSLFSDYDT